MILGIVEVLMVEVEDVVGGFQELIGLAAGVDAPGSEVVVDGIGAPVERPIQPATLDECILIIGMLAEMVG